MSADLVPVQALLLERFASHGVDVDAVLRHAGLVRSRFEGPSPRVTTGEFFGLWNAVETFGAPSDLGLRLGSEPSPHRLHVAWWAALQSATYGEALKKFARYKRLVCPELILVETVGGEASVRFYWLLAEEASPRLLVDATFASTVALGRRGTGKTLAPKRIEVARRRAGEGVLARHFGCPIVFDAAFDRIVFDERALAEPFVTPSPDLLAAIGPGLAAALEAPPSTRPLVDEVRIVLSRRMCGDRPSVARIAKELRVSARTLQRRLEEAGTTYQTLLDEVRRTSARRLLAHTDLEAGEIAFLLGFEEMNSFTRAFHGWEGTTPTRWRAAPVGERAAFTS